MVFVGVIFLCFFIPTSIGNVDDGPIADTGRGRLRGVYDTSRNGLRYEAYLGIRYAQVPRRFDVSVPTGSWEGVTDAVKHGPHCAQTTLVGSPATGEEDCLYLNVYTPKADNGKRAVLFFVHGGGFSMGASTEFGGGFLVDEDIVLVTINYRLGILGFLNTPRGPVAGNMGLKDQVEALKWVHNNIHHFGGDKDRVTISGNSAGSASALYLMMAPQAQGLFQRVYGMSGTTLNPFAFRKSNLEDAFEMGEHINCKGGRDQVDLVNCLREEPVETLMLAQKSIMQWNLDLFRILPTLEVNGPLNPEPFLDETPTKRLFRGDFSKVPVLLTSTQDEGALTFAALVVRNEALLESLNDDFDKVGAVTFKLEDEFGPRTEEVTKAMKQFYFENKVITPQMENNLSEAYSDTWFFRGIEQTARVLSSHQPVYLGLFTHPRSDFSPVQMLGVEETIEAVEHCEDMSYVFHPTGVSNPTPFLAKLKDAKDIEFSKKYVSLLASFFKYGTPKSPFAGNGVWRPISGDEVTPDSINWFGLEDHTPVHKNPFGKRMNFWRDLVNKVKGTTSAKTEL